MREELAPHVQDINRALGEKVSEDEIVNELENYLSVYRVSLETAKRSIVRKHGGNPANLMTGVEKKVSGLMPGDPSVNILARVVSANEKDIEGNGNPKRIIYGILGDETGTVPFTAWETEGLELEKGDVIHVVNAYTREFRGEVQVNFGSRARIEKGEADDLPPYDIPTQRAVVGERKVKELREGMSGVGVTARVLAVERREVQVAGEPKVVFSGLMADETGKVQFSAWSDFGLEQGTVLKVEGGYVKSWRGIPQMSFDDRSVVEILKDDVLPPAEELSDAKRMWIEDIAQRGGGVDVKVRGILIEVKEGSGLIHRCPECKRVLRRGSCRIHGEVEGTADLRIKGVVDDGSGALTVIAGKDLTEAILGKELDACLEEAKDAMSTEVIRDQLADLLIAQPVEFRGNVTGDDYGLMMISTAGDIIQVDVQSEARALLEELEVQ